MFFAPAVPRRGRWGGNAAFRREECEVHVGKPAPKHNPAAKRSKSRTTPASRETVGKRLTSDKANRTAKTLRTNSPVVKRVPATAERSGRVRAASTGRGLPAKTAKPPVAAKATKTAKPVALPAVAKRPPPMPAAKPVVNGQKGKLVRTTPPASAANPPALAAKAPLPVKPPAPVQQAPPPPTLAAVTPAPKPKRNPSGLSARDLQRFADLLLEKRREIVGDMHSMEGEALRSGSSGLSTLPVHMADMGTDNYEQEFTLGLVEKDRLLLREINHALAKIAAGTFGICEGTGDPIGKPRLEVQPWARHSIEYARLRERNGRGVRMF
jgi:DnaK suppressor protein